MLHSRRAAPEVPDISAFDMTPMIDVTFQLIIFFMLVMDMSSNQYQPLKQPAARHAVRLVEPDEVVVSVTADGRLNVFGKAVNDDGLLALLEAHRRSRREDFPVLVRADKSAPFESLQKVMMMTQHVGGVSRLRFGARMEVNR
jgi:biopolymer transport protein ExbD